MYDKCNTNTWIFSWNHLFTHQRHDVASPECAPPLACYGLWDCGYEGGSALRGRGSGFLRWRQEAAWGGATQQYRRCHRSPGGRMETRQMHGWQSRLGREGDVNWLRRFPPQPYKSCWITSAMVVNKSICLNLLLSVLIDEWYFKPPE